MEAKRLNKVCSLKYLRNCCMKLTFAPLSTLNLQSYPIQPVLIYFGPTEGYCALRKTSSSERSLSCLAGSPTCARPTQCLCLLLAIIRSIRPSNSLASRLTYIGCKRPSEVIQTPDLVRIKLIGL